MALRKRGEGCERPREVSSSLLPGKQKYFLALETETSVCSSQSRGMEKILAQDFSSVEKCEPHCGPVVSREF